MVFDGLLGVFGWPGFCSFTLHVYDMVLVSYHVTVSDCVTLFLLFYIRF